MSKYHNIPIIVYHKLSKQKENKNYTFEEKEFNNDIKYLHDNFYASIIAEDFTGSMITPSQSLLDKNVMITFDDGHESDYNIVLPILKTYELKATFFITTDWIGTDGYMDIQQIRSLKKEGMSIQSHSNTHNFLDSMGRNEIFQEISKSKKKLEDILGSEVTCLSFPGGRFNTSVIECARELGLKVLFSSDPYYFKDFGDVKLIGRCMAKHVSGMSNVIQIVRMTKSGRLGIINANKGKTMLRKILGNGLYHGIWKMLNSRD